MSDHQKIGIKSKSSFSVWDERLKKMKSAQTVLKNLSTKTKNVILNRLSESLLANVDAILAANQRDLQQFKSNQGSSAFQDRLTLDSKRVQQIADGVRQVASLPDPVGSIDESKVLANGLDVRKVRSPLGCILMIFESRPNVAIDAFCLAFKSGNGVVLRGGSEARHTLEVFYQLIHSAIQYAGHDSAKPLADCVVGVTDYERTLVDYLLHQSRYIDIVIPRGGEKLIQHVQENASMPIIKNDRGLCHLYVHKDADLEMAAEILLNGKVQRPGVCNSLETLLVDEAVADQALPKLFEKLLDANVRWHVCDTSFAVLQQNPVQISGGLLTKADQHSYSTEYLSLDLNCKVVASLEQALEHIAQFGSKHSECIVTTNKDAAESFIQSVDAAAAYWNASTRFTDGFELGLGAEIGISTQKLHVRGPVGLRELTSLHWEIRGNGQIRK